MRGEGIDLGRGDLGIAEEAGQEKAATGETDPEIGAGRGGEAGIEIVTTEETKTRTRNPDTGEDLPATRAVFRMYLK